MNTFFFITKLALADLQPWETSVEQSMSIDLTVLHRDYICSLSTGYYLILFLFTKHMNQPIKVGWLAHQEMNASVFVRQH